jgi:Acetyltransferase (GNAT) domain
MRAVRLTAANRDRAGEVWRVVEETMRPPLWSSSWEWTSLWLEHFADSVQHDFVVVEDDIGSPCGIALLCHGKIPSRIRRVRSAHIGTAALWPPEDVYLECNRLIARPEAREELARAVLEELSRDGRWEEFVLNGFVAADAELIARAAPALRLEPEASPYAELGVLAERGGGDVVAGLGRNTRQQVRRGLRELGDPTCEIASDPDRALAVFDELVELHQARWSAEGQHGAFADERVVSFHRELIRQRAPDRALLCRVEAAGRTVACLYSFLEDGVVFFFQAGIAQESDSKVRPGLVAHALCMATCLERGLREYDFLAPESRYKRQLSTAERTLFWGSMRR